VIASLSGQPVQAPEVGAVLEERDRRLLFEILFEEANEPTWEEAMSCIEALQHRQAEPELAGNHQRRKNFFRLQSVIETGILQMLCKLLAQALRLGPHANQSPFDRFRSAPDQFQTGLDFAAPLLRRFAQCRTQQRLIDAKLLRDPCGPFRAPNAVLDFLYLRPEGN